MMAIVGVAFLVAGLFYLSTSVPLGLLGAVSGLLIIASAVLFIRRKKRTIRSQ